MIWAKARCLTDWAAYAPHPTLYLNNIVNKQQPGTVQLLMVSLFIGLGIKFNIQFKDSVVHDLCGQCMGQS